MAVFFSGAIRTSFENASDEAIERAIADSLINSRDRSNGRERRRHKSAGMLPEPSDTV